VAWATVLVLATLSLVASPAGAASWNLETRVPLIAPALSEAWGLGTGDLDGDGLPELLVGINYDIYSATPPYGNLTAYRYKASHPNLYEPIATVDNVSRRIPIVTGNQMQLPVLDVDRDGFNETLFIGWMGGAFGLHVLSLVGGTFEADAFYGLPMPSAPPAVEPAGLDLAVADVTGDGFPEIVLGHATAAGTTEGVARLVVLQLTGTTFVELAELIRGDTNLEYAMWVRAADTDADGVKEILVAETYGTIRAYRYDAGQLVQQGATPAGSDTCVCLAIGELDGTAFPEVVRVTYDGTLTIFRWDGTNYSQVDEFDLPARPSYCFAGEMDADGRDELALDADNDWTHALRVYEWVDGNLTETWGSGTLLGWSRIDHIGDADGDGVPELVQSGRGDMYFRVYQTAEAASGRPDLVVTPEDVAVDGVLEVHRPLMVSAILRNEGNATAYNVSLELALDGESRVTLFVNALPPGDFRRLAFPITFADPGPHQIEASAEASGPIPEENVLNNHAARSFDVVLDATPPVADAGPNLRGDRGQEFVLNGSGSWDNVGIVSYQWTIEDTDSTVTLTGEMVTWTPDAAGNFTATLVVMDAAGLSDEDEATLRVSEPPPPDDDGDEDDVPPPLWPWLVLVLIFLLTLLLVGLLLSRRRRRGGESD
jgi:hypothetical protein